MQNSQRTFSDDGLYNDFIDNNKTQLDRLDTIDLTKVDDIFLKNRTYYPERICVKSVQGQATLSITTTWVVAWTSMLTTDIVQTQITSEATAAYIQSLTVSTAGFTVIFNTAPGIGTFDWQVFRLVSALT